MGKVTVKWAVILKLLFLFSLFGPYEHRKRLASSQLENKISCIFFYFVHWKNRCVQNNFQEQQHLTFLFNVP